MRFVLWLLYAPILLFNVKVHTHPPLLICLEQLICLLPFAPDTIIGCLDQAADDHGVSEKKVAGAWLSLTGYIDLSNEECRLPLEIFKERLEVQIIDLIHNNALPASCSLSARERFLAFSTSLR
jgi:hypothetical protein